MAVFRVEKNRDYTVIANHHLRDKTLSLKAKGLLTLMLSLPEGWDYTTNGLAFICKDGVDSICAAVRELERHGYVQRRRVRDVKGQLRECEYTILELPFPDDAPAPPKEENPVRENPVPDAPVQAEPVLENPMQLSTKKSNTEKSNTDSSSTHSFFPSPPAAEGETERKNNILAEREKIREQIEHEYVYTPYNREQVDEFVELMLEVALSRSPTIKIGRDAEYPTAFVQERFSQLTSSHIEKVLDGIKDNTTRVWNTRAYLLAALFNAPSTTDNHYTMLVNHDFHRGGA